MMTWEEDIREKALTEGMEEGMEKGIEKIVIRMLKRGKSKTEIMDDTGVSEQKFDTIAASVRSIPHS